MGGWEGPTSGEPSRHTTVEVVAVNDVTDVETLAHLLRYDSTFGPYPRGSERSATR
jgi:glyceraldehyde-3-phosphate dehydrogenase/erythrose-4-phosphate dehydrogenase